MIAPRRPPSAYSSVRWSSSRPSPADWCSGSTTSSERPHSPSRSIASAAPTSSPSRSMTHAPPGSRSISWLMRISASSGRGGGCGGSCRRSPSSVKVLNESRWTPSASSLRIGRGADIRSETSRAGRAGTRGSRGTRAGDGAGWCAARCRRAVARAGGGSPRTGVSRALRLAISELRPWKTSALTLSRGTASTVAISSWGTAPSPASTIAARWSSGRAATSASRSRRSWRRWTALERCSVDGSSAGVSGAAAALAQQRVAAVAGDRVEPRPQLDRLAGRRAGRGRRP